ncbi:imidazolonepropionase [Vibrio sp.]|uniref:Imidazolonepropionase n=1 Tax=Vibrio viridaestus TaxID=2487322 RepID=A0A3N9THI9_9VIBR|nr:imidazolonepropionase [Vibrio viridaestus]MDC0609633.1 imidazolonepropionase [Vibrio sp.]RQW63344.1 imidazolonepropionase [Vibrio viridaestus]
MHWILKNVHIVTMEQGENGYSVSNLRHIEIKNGQIFAVHQDINEVATGIEVIDGHEALVSPGLIDCHTHLVFGGNRANEFEMRLQGVPYTEIANQGGGIIATVNATRAASIDELVEYALPRLDGLIRSGVTTVEVKSGYGLNLEDEIKMLKAAKILSELRPIKIQTTLLAAHAIPPEYKTCPDDYVNLICDRIIPEVSKQNLADAVDVFCESIGFSLEQTEKVFQCAIKYGLKVKGHTEQLSNLGGSALTAKYNGLSVDHIEYLDEAGVKAIAQSDTVATLLPGAFYFLRETQYPPVELLREFNVPIAISTDANPGTSPFYDLTLMMNMACTIFGLTPEESLRGVTCNAAKALGLESMIGQIKPGMAADLTLWNTNHPADLSYQFGHQKALARIVDGHYYTI